MARPSIHVRPIPGSIHPSTSLAAGVNGSPGHSLLPARAVKRAPVRAHPFVGQRPAYVGSLNRQTGFRRFVSRAHRHVPTFYPRSSRVESSRAEQQDTHLQPTNSSRTCMPYWVGRQDNRLGNGAVPGVRGVSVGIPFLPCAVPARAVPCPWLRLHAPIHPSLVHARGGARLSQRRFCATWE